MLHNICSGCFTQVRKPWPGGLSFYTPSKLCLCVGGEGVYCFHIFRLSLYPSIMFWSLQGRGVKVEIDISFELSLGNNYTPGMQSMRKGYIVFIHSVSPFVCPSVFPGVIPSINPLYNQALLRSFLITYNSAATDKKLFIFGMGVPERVLFHSTSVDPWVMSQGGA